MRNLINCSFLVSSLALISLSAYAEKSENYILNGSQDVYIPLKSISNNINTTYNLETLNGLKKIKLMSITASKNMIEKNRAALAALSKEGGEIDYKNGIISFSKFDPKNGSVDLGMENVPVMDQGSYGTCVTFASTAALNARLNKGDFIDQQCTLALNKSLGNDYWEGADNATEIYIPLKKYGIILKDKCFGTLYGDPEQKVSLTKYKRKSTKIYAEQIKYNFIKIANLDKVKESLNLKQRVVLGTALANIKYNSISVNGFDIKVDGNSPGNGGLWACQQPGDVTNYCPENPTAGHEIVIMGYDDKQQLLKIRNSWGSETGDKGDFYMTYAFFNAMAIDHTIVN